MSTKIKIYFVFLIFFLINVSNVLAMDIRIELFDANGNVLPQSSYTNPNIIDTNMIRWKVVASGSEADKKNYTTYVKMSGSRSSPCREEHRDITYNELQNRIFEWEAMAGMYTIVAGDKDMDNFDKEYVHCRVPPLKSYTLPYRPPLNNHAPEPKITLLNNIKGGKGTTANPYIIDQPIIRFRLDDTFDSDGQDDLRYGVFHWVVRNKGYHEAYSGGEQNCSVDPCRTFLFWDDIDGRIFEWDVRGRPAGDNKYVFGFYAIDQYGERANENNALVVTTESRYNRTCVCDEWINQGCGEHCFPNQMFQTRNCNPHGCDLQTYCRYGYSECSINPGVYPDNTCSMYRYGRKPKIELNKTVDKIQAVSGEIITYTLTYTNNSKFKAYNVILTDEIPSKGEYIFGSATGNPEFNDGILKWKIAELGANLSGEFIFKIRIK